MQFLPIVSLEETRTQGKGDTLHLESDLCKGNPFLWYVAGSTCSPHLHHPFSPPSHFSHLCAWALLLSEVLQRCDGDTHSQSSIGTNSQVAFHWQLAC